jgi:tocopherol cyclase
VGMVGRCVCRKCQFYFTINDGLIAAAKEQNRFFWLYYSYSKKEKWGLHMRGYFSGRYYKHQKDGKTICFIIGRAGSGDFVQVITNDRILQFDGLKHCRVDDDGLTIDLPGIHGSVSYGPFTPIRSDIMGPFRFLPMQCRHEVVSLTHPLAGGFTVGGELIDLNGGIGYIEGDRGRSFPKEYLWLHCNDFAENCSIMASVADIPLCGIHFKGCICVVFYKGTEYRLATYHGVRIVCATNRQLLLEQGPLRLEVTVDNSRAHPLKAPKAGRMTETIHESNCSPSRFRFWVGARLLFDLTSKNCSFECNLHEKGGASPIPES